jgi:hypothetical protein
MALSRVMEGVENVENVENVIHETQYIASTSDNAVVVEGVIKGVDLEVSWLRANIVNIKARREFTNDGMKK